VISDYVFVVTAVPQPLLIHAKVRTNYGREAPRRRAGWCFATTRTVRRMGRSQSGQVSWVAVVGQR
jgi:hypothetical protein